MPWQPSLLCIAAATTLVLVGCAPRAAQTPADLAVDRAAADNSPVPALPGLRRGINLGNALDAPQEGEWGVTLSETHFEMAAAGGFDHIRLPVRFSAHTEPAAPYRVEETFFQRVDWAIEQALSRKLAIIVDLHHYDELMEDPEAHTERFLAIWEQIATRYADRPEQVKFELFNEPCKQFNPVRVNAMVSRVLPIIRQSNPTRWIVVDSYFWAAGAYLGALELPTTDPYLAASFHMYQPMLFTHQGAPWMGPEYQTLGVQFPGPPDKPITPEKFATSMGWVKDWFRRYNTEPPKTNPSGPATLDLEFDYASRFAAKTGRPVYLGEFGVIDRADEASRVRWLRAVRGEAERRQLAWAYWDNGGEFTVMDVKQKRWQDALRRALLQ
jgi:endoglucanase